MRWTLFDRFVQKWIEAHVTGRFVSPKIKRILYILYPSCDLEEICRSYYREKLVLMLRIGMVSSVLIMFVIVSEYASSLENTGNIYMREEESQQITLNVQTEGTDKANITYEINPKRYTPAQIQEYVNRFRKQGASLILGKNENLKEVCSDLCLQETYEDYPMQFSWESSDYARITQDGSVENENIKKPQNVIFIIRRIKITQSKK